MGPVLERERAFYNAHQAEWAALHPGRFVVVKGEELVGIYETMDLALAAGASRFGLDSFLVRKLGEAEQEIHVPALALGLLFAPSHGPTEGESVARASWHGLDGGQSDPGELLRVDRLRRRRPWGRERILPTS